MKIVLLSPDDSSVQDLEGLQAKFQSDDLVVIEVMPDHLKVTMPKSYVNPFIEIVDQFGYYATTIQDT